MLGLVAFPRPRISSNTPLATRDPPIPPIPHFTVELNFDRRYRLGVIDVYQTAIQMMYDLAQRPYNTVIQATDSRQYKDYNVLILFLNTGPPESSMKLQVMHCVATLYQAVQVMTDEVLFVPGRAAMTLRQVHIGENSGNDVTEKEEEGDAAPALDVGEDTGHIADPDFPQFSIDFQFLGRPINSKEISLAVFEALTVATPVPRTDECIEIMVSTDRGCVIIVEGTHGAQRFTYQWATRALKLLYQEVMVARKRFGDVKLDIKYEGKIFGQLRVLRTDRGVEGNGTEVVSSE
ncbi:MAG: hypothetical protein Q9169_007349 [Polycauliona sp. 2 TL-2023]